MVNILVACTGSVASIKLPLLLAHLTSLAGTTPIALRVVVTEPALHFIPTDALPAGVTLYRDADEYTTWSRMGDPVLHIDLRAWADVLVVAPLSANTLAKVAAGMCDNLVTCVLRAWQLQTKPVWVAPAMNTAMWDHPVTAEHLAKVRAWGYRVIEPVSKMLACGDVGKGAMAEPETIARHVLQSVNALAAQESL